MAEAPITGATGVRSRSHMSRNPLLATLATGGALQIAVWQAPFLGTTRSPLTHAHSRGSLPACTGGCRQTPRAALGTRAGAPAARAGGRPRPPPPPRRSGQTPRRLLQRTAPPPSASRPRRKPSSVIAGSSSSAVGRWLGRSAAFTAGSQSSCRVPDRWPRRGAAWCWAV